MSQSVSARLGAACEPSLATINGRQATRETVEQQRLQIWAGRRVGGKVDPVEQGILNSVCRELEPGRIADTRVVSRQGIGLLDDVS